MQKKINAKKVLIYASVALEICAILFLLVISILVIIKNIEVTNTAYKPQIRKGNYRDFIEYLIYDDALYFFAFVMPLIILMIINVAVLISFLYKKKHQKKVKLSDLPEEQKIILMQETLEEMKNNR